MAKRKSNAKSRQNYYDEHDSFLSKNPIPIQIPTEYNQKKFSPMDMINVKPLTHNQQRVFDLWSDNYSMILAGSAGTGKSFLAIYLALNEILSNNSEYDSLIIVRSAVPAREQGFVPGTQEEKNSVYESPYIALFDEIFKKKNQYKFLKEVGIVKFETTAFIRGKTFDNSIIIFDEFQNANWEELSTVATRVGKNSKVLFCGDIAQNDLHRKRNDDSGFDKFVSIADRVPSFRRVTFTRDDIVRSSFVKEFIIATEDYEDRQN